jgi:hypothetical protein
MAGKRVVETFPKMEMLASCAEHRYAEVLKVTATEPKAMILRTSERT